MQGNRSHATCTSTQPLHLDKEQDQSQELPIPVSPVDYKAIVRFNYGSYEVPVYSTEADCHWQDLATVLSQPYFVQRVLMAG